jgi:hypothetical protein
MLTALVWASVFIVVLVFVRALLGAMDHDVPNEPPRAWIPEFFDCEKAGHLHSWAPWIDLHGNPVRRCDNCLSENNTRGMTKGRHAFFSDGK